MAWPPYPPHSLTLSLLRVPGLGSAPIQSRGHINCPSTPWSACVCWGEGSLPPIHRPTRGWGGGCRGTCITLSSFHTHPLRFQFPNMYRHGRYLYEGGMGTRGPSTLTHTTSYTGTVLGRLCGGGQGLPSTIVFLLGLSLRVGGFLLPWGKGLILVRQSL